MVGEYNTHRLSSDTSMAAKVAESIFQDELLIAASAAQLEGFTETRAALLSLLASEVCEDDVPR